jgi:anti-sigma-K factor RskA
MTDEHQQFHGWAASYVLGALDGDDRRAFERHLGRCAVCTSELNEFAPVPSLLAKIDPADLDDGPDPVLSDRIAVTARSEFSALRVRHRVWRAAAIAATAAAALLTVMLMVDREATPVPDQQSATIVSSSALETNVAVTPKGWGTEIVLNITELPYRDGYQLWTVDNLGNWSHAASWSPTRSGGVRLTGASRVPLDHVDRIVITSLDRDDVLVEASG